MPDINTIGLALSRVEEGNGVIGCTPRRNTDAAHNRAFVAELFELRLIYKPTKATPPRLTHLGRETLHNWRQVYALERQKANEKSTQDKTSEGTQTKHRRC